MKSKDLLLLLLVLNRLLDDRERFHSELDERLETLCRRRQKLPREILGETNDPPIHD